MDFNYSAEDEAFRKDLRGWLEKNRDSVPPAREILSEDDDTWKTAVAWHKKLNEGKWMAINWPKAYGGRGASLLQSVIYHEEFERAGTSVPFYGIVGHFQI